MATKCHIGIKSNDDTIKYIYCGSDGYLSYVGACLLTNYQDTSKIFELISNGAIASLGKEIGNKVDYDNLDTQTKLEYLGKQVIFFKRDKNCKDEKFTSAISTQNEKNVFEECIAYLYKNGKWYYGNTDEYNDYRYVELTADLIIDYIARENETCIFKDFKDTYL